MAPLFLNLDSLISEKKPQITNEQEAGSVGLRTDLDYFEKRKIRGFEF
jgi:hypothetical protein